MDWELLSRLKGQDRLEYMIEDLNSNLVWIAALIGSIGTTVVGFLALLIVDALAEIIFIVVLIIISWVSQFWVSSLEKQSTIKRYWKKAR